MATKLCITYRSKVIDENKFKVSSMLKYTKQFSLKSNQIILFTLMFRCGDNQISCSLVIVLTVIRGLYIIISTFTDIKSNKLTGATLTTSLSLLSVGISKE